MKPIFTITATRYIGCIVLTFFFSANAFAQPIVAPTQLVASYKKYTNRIDLTWRAAAPDHRYIIQRRKRGVASFSALDTVAQNRYVDRKKLEINYDYTYRVQAIDGQGKASKPSNEAVGALLAVADGRDSLSIIIPLDSCIRLDITQAKISATHFLVKFMADYNDCKLPIWAELSLYQSEDAIFDEQDAFLVRQKMRLTRKRGAITAPVQEGKKSGYFILKLEVDGREMWVAKTVER